MPSENYLSRSFALGLGYLFDNRICKHVHILKLARPKHELSGSNRAIWRQIDIVLFVEFDHFSLLKVWVALNLIDSWAYLAVSKDIAENWEGAIAYSNAFDETFLHKCFHLLPHYMVWWRKNLPSLPVDCRLHPMYEVQVYVIELQALQTRPTRRLHIILFILVKLSSDKHILAIDSRFEAYFKGFTYLFFITVAHSCIQVSVAVLDDSLREEFRSAFNETSTKADCWNLMATVQSVS